MAHTKDPRSATTANCGLEKPVRGAYRDGWADLLNDNYDLIDAAVVEKAGVVHDHEETPMLGEYLKGLDPYEGDVNVACITGLTTGTPDFQLASSPGRWFLSVDQRTRIRQDTTVIAVQFYVGPSNLPTSFWIMFWRKNAAGTWDYVGGEDVRSKMTAGQINWINLDTPIQVKTGDYVGYGGIGTGMFLTPITGAAISTYYKNMAQPTGTYDWTTAGTIGTYLPLRVFGDPPVVVCIGDSITAGHPGNYSYIEASQIEDPLSDYTRQIAARTGVTVQNMGIGGQTSTQVAARFLSDCAYLRPRVAIIEVGLNDIQQGVTEAQFMANVRSMLETCRTHAYPMVPVFVGLPWTGATDAQSADLRRRYERVRALLEYYDDAVFVPAWLLAGSGREYWDIRARYDYGDQLHYNRGGYSAIATAILSASVHARRWGGLVPGFQALYLFDEGAGESVTDYAWNGNGGTLGGAATPAWVDGGLGLTADGYVTLPEQSFGGAYTIQFVASRASASGPGIVLSGEGDEARLGFGAGEQLWVRAVDDGGIAGPDLPGGGAVPRLVTVRRSAAGIVSVSIGAGAPSVLFGGEAQAGPASFGYVGAADGDSVDGTVSFAIFYPFELSMAEGIRNSVAVRGILAPRGVAV